MDAADEWTTLRELGGARHALHRLIVAAELREADRRHPEVHYGVRVHRESRAEVGR